MLSSTSSDPLSYKPAGSSAVTTSVVPMVIALPDVEPELLPPLSLPAPHAARATAPSPAAPSTSPLLRSDLTKFVPSTADECAETSRARALVRLDQKPMR